MEFLNDANKIFWVLVSSCDGCTATLYAVKALSLYRNCDGNRMFVLYLIDGMTLTFSEAEWLIFYL